MIKKEKSAEFNRQSERQYIKIDYYIISAKLQRGKKGTLSRLLSRQVEGDSSGST